jgi:CRP/FNR family transcriptional regulator
LKKSVSVLSTIPFFDGLSESQLNEIRKMALDRIFDKGEAIFFEGDEGNGFFVVVEGLVKIFKGSTEGKEQILHIFGAGEPVGEVPVFSGERFPANAEALTKSHLLFFPKSAFVDLIAGDPSLALNMLGVLSRRLREFAGKIAHLSLKEVPGRLAAYLLYLADEQDNKDVVILPISKGHLASLLGTIPETLSRIFARMSGQKLIEVTGGTIKLLDRRRLNKLSERGTYGNEIKEKGSWCINSSKGT